MEIVVKNVVELIELNRKRLELELKKSYLEQKEDETAEQASLSLDETNKSISELSANIDKAGIRFRLLEQEKISDINGKLSTFSPSDQVSALTSKEGEVYDLLKERGLVLKKNFENRENVAKLLMLVSQVTDPKMRSGLTDAIERGSITEAIDVSGCDHSLLDKIVLLLNRVGVSASSSESEEGKMITSSPSEMKEIPFVISNKKVWVAAEAADRLTQNLEKLEKVHPQLQWKNAQRQIKDLSEDEEKEFKDLQHKYLNLLKEQDEILKEFIEEEKLAVKVA